MFAYVRLNSHNQKSRNQPEACPEKRRALAPPRAGQAAGTSLAGRLLTEQKRAKDENQIKPNQTKSNQIEQKKEN